MVESGTVYAEYTTAATGGSNGAYLMAFPFDSLLSANDPGASLPRSFSVSAYPNPFNSETRLMFNLSCDTKVILTAFDVSGRRIEELINGMRSAGQHEILWSARGLPSGVYFLDLRVGKMSATQEVLLIR
jgi:hypothetical protein